jgi:hypothetical protein
MKFADTKADVTASSTGRRDMKSATRPHGRGEKALFADKDTTTTRGVVAAVVVRSVGRVVGVMAIVAEDNAERAVTVGLAGGPLATVRSTRYCTSGRTADAAAAAAVTATAIILSKERLAFIIGFVGMVCYWRWCMASVVIHTGMVETVICPWCGIVVGVGVVVGVHIGLGMW